VAGAAGTPDPLRVARLSADRLLALLLVVLVTSRVLSPQYLLWVLAVTAAGVALTPPEPAVPPGVGAADGARGARIGPVRGLLGALGALRGFGAAVAGGSRRAVRVLVVMVAAVSQVIYPIRYNDVIEGRVLAGSLLVARNLLLVAAVWCALRALTVPDADGSPARRWRRARPAPSPRPEQAPASQAQPVRPAAR
jgi:hypothetical protein